MTFAHPLAFWLVLVAIPVVILYMRRVGLDRRTVATGMFWEQVFEEQRARTRWQRWRNKVSLAVELLLVAIGTLAAAGPQIPRPELVVLVIDNSASMDATDVAPSRLAAAKAYAHRLIDALGPDDQMAVLTAGGTPTVVSIADSDRAQLRAAIDSIQPKSALASMAAALRVAEAFPVSPGATRRIVVLSDGCFADAAALSAQHGFELVRFGTPAPNTAITRWTVRRGMADPRECQVLAETRNYSPRSAECQLVVAMEGRPIDTVHVSMPPNGRWQQVFSMTTSAGGTLTARLGPPDAYRADNFAIVYLPPAPTYRIQYTAAGTQYPVLSTQYSVLSTRGSPPSPLFRALLANPLVEIVDAKAADGRRDAGPSVSIQVARLAEDSPILAGVSIVDVYLGGAKPLELTEAAKTHARPLLWMADGTPLGYAIERPEGRVVVLCGSLAESNLAMQTAFPIFVTNALDWLAAPPVRAERDQKPAGCVGAITPSLDLRAPADLGVDPDSAVIRQPRPPARLWPAVLVFAILMMEWCLYQRRWMS
ncbi:MAG: VWA domain-containing protein [Thermoguttaceae bacterium]